MAGQFLHGVQVVEIDSGPRPIRTVSSAVIGIVGTAPDADPALFPLNTPVLIAGSPALAGKLSTVAGAAAGTLAPALDLIFAQAGAVVVVVRVAEGSTETETLANVIGGTNGVTGKYEGISALLGAESALGVVPRILVAPGWTHQRPMSGGVAVKNPVAAALATVAERLRAVAFVDGPNTTDAAALQVAADHGSARVYVVDPWVQVLDRAGAVVTVPASPAFAGVLAKSDEERGFWWSVSNLELQGVLGLGRPIDFKLGDASSRANLLNAGKVGTIIRQDGFRTWGNRSTAMDQKWAFLMTRRIADMINDSLLRAHLWAVDRNITRSYVSEVAEGVNDYLRQLRAMGAILGGKCWPDPDLNTPQALAAGEVYFNFDFTPPYPAEHIVFRSHLVADYLEEVIQ